MNGECIDTKYLCNGIKVNCRLLDLCRSFMVTLSSNSVQLASSAQFLFHWNIHRILRSNFTFFSHLRMKLVFMWQPEWSAIDLLALNNHEFGLEEWNERQVSFGCHDAVASFGSSFEEVVDDELLNEPCSNSLIFPISYIQPVGLHFRRRWNRLPKAWSQNMSSWSIQMFG